MKRFVMSGVVVDTFPSKREGRVNVSIKDTAESRYYDVLFGVPSADVPSVGENISCFVIPKAYLSNGKAKVFYCYDCKCDE